MIVIVEGPDNAGKSTLVSWLECMTGMHAKRGDGPEKYPGEMQERIKYYPVAPLYDRHPAISDAIYDIARGKPDRRDKQLKLIPHLGDIAYVYCRPPDYVVFDLSHHRERKGVDTPEQLALINQKQGEIVALYDDFFFRYSHRFALAVRYDWTANRAPLLRMFIGSLLV